MRSTAAGEGRQFWGEATSGGLGLRARGAGSGEREAAAASSATRQCLPWFIILCTQHNHHVRRAAPYIYIHSTTINVHRAAPYTHTHTQHTLTTQAVGRAQARRGHGHDALEALPGVLQLGGDQVLLAQHQLQVMVGLLALEVVDAAVQGIDLVLGALADGALGLAVVRALAGELLGREVGHASRRRAGAALLRGRLRGTAIGVVGWAIVGRAVGVPGHFITGPICSEVLGVVEQESCGA